VDYSLPPRTPCTDRRHRPGRLATRGTLLASPWCFRAQCRCRCVAAAAAGVVTGTQVGRRRRVRWNKRAQVRQTVCSQHCRQSVNGPNVVRKSSPRDGELCNLRPRARTPTNERAAATGTDTDSGTGSRRVKKSSSVRAEKAPNLQLQQPSVPSRRLVVAGQWQRWCRGSTNDQGPSPTAERHGLHSTHTRTQTP
jgi:hypothetical protein